MAVLEKIKEHRMIGILRGYDTEDAVKIVGALVQNDFRVIEVALNSPNAKETLKALKENFGNEITLGAGTVLTVEDAQDCIDIGVEFLLAPVYGEAVLKFANEQGVLYIPGCYTPTEIYDAHMAGAKMIKVFPAGQLGASYIKDVLAPMNDLVLLPTGGVSADNINTFLEVGAAAVGINSALVPSNRKVDEALEIEISERVKELKGKVE
ncbi:bifunctional 4-hydroxy-2-oxoglutarate aldolase/2-dehydro-3-deoxy-phosphogluconate aldolase [Salinicoccus sp. ID82-1]|uniref:bifunctional 4-hydroxy-2-oxoglutarate aldolase/2-dehydro-3-deoxy-phosphogluconate aldolase n=1 Tax=Salinicoccus sp. ID82-1 TaxID=2820269 RepID=UPI001F2483A6|nr:bifunctional 4-hydroxy-2-oxoglutarate aldolase/2-dehydro-3-deoxy-phosphogluconate aldolase [Salinicoccus sp. ID82-1]MCG1009645.1 bifunctional 4-hydroxy-2-oxoglutarate aldolase/2-dehydro-3-deoxy-phosphogluconate aldolase [Salinicoccus sp. ID82-1]